MFAPPGSPIRGRWLELAASCPTNQLKIKGITNRAGRGFKFFVLLRQSQGSRAAEALATLNIYCRMKRLHVAWKWSSGTPVPSDSVRGDPALGTSQFDGHLGEPHAHISFCAWMIQRDHQGTQVPILLP